MLHSWQPFMIHPPPHAQPIADIVRGHFASTARHPILDEYLELVHGPIVYEIITARREAAK